MQLQQPFNANAVAPDQGGNYQQLPIGKHPVKIIASEVKANSSGTGGMVAFELEVIDGPARGATGNMNINLYNASEKARAIAEAQMSALCHVTGVFMLNDTSQLHGIPFAVDVTNQSLTPDQKAKQDAGETVTPFTQVRKILDINCNEPKGQGQQQQAAAAPAAAWGGGAAPAPAPAPAQGGAWGGGQAAAPAQQAQAPAQQAAAPAAAWGQNNAAGGAKPAWGTK